MGELDARELDRSVPAMSWRSPRTSRTCRCPMVTVWVVRVGDDLYARSHTGRQGTWFRHAVQCHEGRAHAGGVERDVVSEETARRCVKRSTRPIRRSTPGTATRTSRPW